MLQSEYAVPDIIVTADQKALQRALGISPIMARMVQAMLLSNDYISPDDLPELKFSVRQLVYMMRKKLDKHKIEVLNDGCGGYRLTRQSKHIIDRLVEENLFVGQTHAR